MSYVYYQRTKNIRGVLMDIRSIPLEAGEYFVLCTIGEQRCMLFGAIALWLLNHQESFRNQEVEAAGDWYVNRGTGDTTYVVKTLCTRHVSSAHPTFGGLPLYKCDTTPWRER